MNCKPGDLAIIIADPNCGGVDVGKIVEVLRPGIVLGEWECRGSSPLKWENGDTARTGDIPDKYLMPIRGGDGQDETLNWAGAPRKQTA